MTIKIFKTVCTRKMTKYMLQAVSIVFFLLLPCYCTAQIELSAGFDLGYPQMLSNNKIINAGQLSSGLRAAIAYKVGCMQFFPSLNFCYGRMRLPLQQAGENVADLILITAM